MARIKKAEEGSVSENMEETDPSTSTGEVTLLLLLLHSLVTVWWLARNEENCNTLIEVP